MSFANSLIYPILTVYYLGSYFSVHPTPWQHKITTSMQYQQGLSPSLSPLPPHVSLASGITGPVFEDFLLGNTPVELFTVLVLTYRRQQLLLELLEGLRGVPFLHKVIVVWNDPDELGDLDPPNIRVPVLVRY